MRRRTAIGGGAVTVAALTAVVLATTGPTSVAAGSPAVVGSPVQGTVTWAAGQHPPVLPDPEAPGGAVGDVAMDIGTAAGTIVHPRFQYEGPGELELTVSDIVESCRDGKEGGAAVRVRVTTDDLVVGSVIYAHLTDVAVAVDEVVTTDSELGKIIDGLPYDESCWTGPHVHVEWVNYGDWGCDTPHAEDTRLEDGDGVGQVGGDFGDGQGEVCP